MEVARGLHKVLGPGEGLRLQSGPGRDLIFKVTGEDTGGAFDYFIVEVAPRGGPPLHVHHKQEETIHVRVCVPPVTCPACLLEPDR
jgi:quercetin dioxygenase-like cupin family protein